MKRKPVRETALEDWPYQVFPNDLNPNKRFMFGVRLMELIDRIAKICVTRNMDGLEFTNPVYEGEILIFKIAVNRVWNKSMIGVQVVVESPKAQEKRHVVSAYLTIVAINENHQLYSFSTLVTH